MISHASLATWPLEEIAKIHVVTPGRDLHLAECDLARAGGPTATLACAECGRAKWMHETRHDTCPQFKWVTGNRITDEQIMQLRHIRGINHDIQVACGRALNDFGVFPAFDVRVARNQCAEVINATRRFLADRDSSAHPVAGDDTRTPSVQKAKRKKSRKTVRKR